MTKGVRVENKKTLRLISDLRSLNISFSKIAEILNRQEIRTIYGKKFDESLTFTKYKQAMKEERENEVIPTKCIECQYYREMMFTPWCAHYHWNWKPTSNLLIVTKENRNGPLPEKCPFVLTENKTLVYFDIPENGTFIHLDEFIKGVHNGTFTDENCTAFKSTRQRITHIPICPSDVLKKVYNLSPSCVIWFPKQLT